MTRVDRAVEKGETKGLMKMVVDGATDAILGRRDARAGRRRGGARDPGGNGGAHACGRPSPG